MPFYTRDTIQDIIDTEVGVSDWVIVTQGMVNQFAELTGDPVEIHTNEELARQTPFGGTIAHGLLTLSMIGGFVTATEVLIEGVTMGVNYGFKSPLYGRGENGQPHPRPLYSSRRRVEITRPVDHHHGCGD